MMRDMYEAIGGTNPVLIDVCYKVVTVIVVKNYLCVISEKIDLLERQEKIKIKLLRFKLLQNIYHFSSQMKQTICETL